MGLENLTIRKVSEYAGVSVGLKHDHFESRNNRVYKTFVHLIRCVQEQLIGGRLGIVGPVERMKFTANIRFSDEVMSQGAANVWPHVEHIGAQ